MWWNLDPRSSSQTMFARNFPTFRFVSYTHCMVRLRLCVRRRVLEQDLREVGMLCDRSRSGSGQLVAQPVGMTGAKRLDRPASSSSHGSSHEEPANFDYQYQAVGRMPYPLPHGWLWCVDPASGSSYYVNEGLKLWQWVHPCEGRVGATQLR